jgi:hypothetical protein
MAVRTAIFQMSGVAENVEKVRCLAAGMALEN